MYSQTLVESLVPPFSLIHKQQMNSFLMYHYADFTFIKSYSLDLEEKIALHKTQLQSENIPLPRGRGGNNISQNIKKCILSILKKILPKQVYSYFEEQCIKKHHLRSQKQNIIIFYLYLHKFYSQSIIQDTHIQEATSLLNKKIYRYIENSNLKMQIQIQRGDFHMKNIKEFRKFLKLNLDFTHKRPFSEVVEYIKHFYIRKVREFHKAVQRLQNVIHSDPYFESLFDYGSIAIKAQQGQQSANFSHS